MEVVEEVEAAAADILEALQEKRDLHETADDKDQYFYVKLPGGLWTAANKGVPTDCAACLNRRMTEQWCKRYGFPRKKSFMFAMYGEACAVQLSREWVRRGNHFYSLWVAQGSSLEYVYSQHDLDSYSEELEWLDFAVEAIEGPALRRIMEVRSWLPLAAIAEAEIVL